MSARYEELRAQVLGQGDGHDALGLVVLLRHGVAAWIDVCAEHPSPPAPRGGTAGEGPMPIEDAAHAELIRVVAGMVLHHYQEEHA